MGPQRDPKNRNSESGKQKSEWELRPETGGKHGCRSVLAIGSRGLNVARNAARLCLSMNVVTYEGFVENGQIRLPDNVRVPERTRVYVVIPGEGQPSAARWMSPRLAHPEQAEDFKLTVTP